MNVHRLCEVESIQTWLFFVFYFSSCAYIKNFHFVLFSACFPEIALLRRHGTIHIRFSSRFGGLFSGLPWNCTTRSIMLKARWVVSSSVVRSSQNECLYRRLLLYLPSIFDTFILGMLPVLDKLWPLSISISGAGNFLQNENFAQEWRKKNIFHFSRNRKRKGKFLLIEH